MLLPIWNAYPYFHISRCTRRATQEASYEARRLDLSSTSTAVAALAQMDATCWPTRTLAEDVRGALEATDVAGACDAIRDYLDVLTNWYCAHGVSVLGRGRRCLRRARCTALVTAHGLAAPLLPLLSEDLARSDGR